VKAAVDRSTAPAATSRQRPSALAVRLQALAGAGRALARAPAATALALSLATLALALPLLLATLAWPLYGAWVRLAAPAQATVFVAGGTSTADIGALRARLAEHRGVAATVHVPRDQALAALLRRTPPGLLPDLKPNPLPDAITVTFDRSASPAEAEAAVAAMRTLARVDSVQFDHLWHRRWSAIVDAARIGGALFAVAIVVLAVGAVAFAAQLPTVTDRAELRLLALVGASATYRRRPFAYAGALIGLAAGLLACALATGALVALGPRLAELQATAAALAWQPLPWPIQAGVVGAAGLIGWLAGVGSGRRAIRGAPVP
jgi:cell division transport system permease protein